jgi:hypothetical protein
VLFGGHRTIEVQCSARKSASQFLYRASLGTICKTQSNRGPLLSPPAREPAIQRLYMLPFAMLPESLHKITLSILSHFPAIPQIYKPSAELHHHALLRFTRFAVNNSDSCSFTIGHSPSLSPYFEARPTAFQTWPFLPCLLFPVSVTFARVHNKK